MITLDTPTAIERFRFLALRGALKLEILGMTRRGRSAYSIIKQEFGFKGNRESVLSQLEKKIKNLKENS